MLPKTPQPRSCALLLKTQYFVSVMSHHCLVKARLKSEFNSSCQMRTGHLLRFYQDGTKDSGDVTRKNLDIRRTSASDDRKTPFFLFSDSQSIFCLNIHTVLANLHLYYFATIGHINNSVVTVINFTVCVTFSQFWPLIQNLGIFKYFHVPKKLQIL